MCVRCGYGWWGVWGWWGMGAGYVVGVVAGGGGAGVSGVMCLRVCLGVGVCVRAARGCGCIWGYGREWGV